MLAIGELSKTTNTKIETIRYYERIGLLAKPARTDGNYRSYSFADLNRLSFIRRARDLGFSLDDVRALLTLADDRSQSCSTVDALAQNHLRDVERKILDLTALRRELASVIKACRGGTVGDCRIIEALGPEHT